MKVRTDVRDALRIHPLFAALDERVFTDLLQRSSVAVAVRGEFLFVRGQRATHFFLVIAGAVNLVLQSQDGDEKVVETVGPGHSFAEALMFQAEPVHPLAAIATESATLLAVPHECYLQLLAGSASTCLRLLTSLSRRLDALVREVESHSMVDARTRLLRHFLELAAAAGAADDADVDLTLPESRTRLAARLSIAPETLSRLLRALQEEGMVAVHGRTVRVPDLARLRASTEGSVGHDESRHAGMHLHRRRGQRRATLAGRGEAPVGGADGRVHARVRVASATPGLYAAELA